MIKDRLENAHRYDGLHRNFRMVFEILQSLNMKALQTGHIELDGDYVYMNVDDAKGRRAEGAKMEAHRKYIDIQLPIDEAETICVANIKDLKMPVGEFDTERDVIFYDDSCRDGACSVSQLITVQPGEFAIFFPEDAHAPNIDCSECHRKIVVKVSVKPNEEKPTL